VVSAGALLHPAREAAIAAAITSATTLFFIKRSPP
jgi:hypothetical protein